MSEQQTEENVERQLMKGRSGVSLYVYSPHKWIRTVALSYPVLILLVIMVSRSLSY